MDNVGYLKRVNGRYEFHSEEMNIVVRGDFVEWVLSATAELVGKLGQSELEGRLTELEALIEFGEANPVDLDIARYEMKERFEILPQCTVTVGKMDYRWVATEGRDKLSGEFDGHSMKRLHDMALTRHDSFLVNEDAADDTHNS